MHPFLEWLGVAVGTFAIGAGLGGWASRDALRSWYPRLRKPALNPPAAVFPTVWTVLYLLMATAFWGVLQHRHEVPWLVRPAAVAYAVQLALNAAWSVLFFTLRRVRLASLDCVLLSGAIVATMVLFRLVAPWTAWLLAPYLAWVCFAGYLTRAFERLNPEFWERDDELPTL